MAALPLTLGAWRAERVPDLIARAAVLARPAGLRWLDDGDWRTDAPAPAPSGVVLLVHGLDEPGGVWDQLAPALHDAGHAVVRFDYPNDQPVEQSATLLADALDTLGALGVGRVQIVAHSMGGLLARDALTRPGRAPTPAVPLLITLGTPHHGSAWAAWQPVGEIRERVQRFFESDDHDLARLFDDDDDGGGQAGDDLLPGSDYLTNLNARPPAQGTRVVCVVGVISDTALPASPADLPGLARALGDGVVPADSAAMPGAAEVLLVHANHRSMVRAIEIGDWARSRLGLAPSPLPPAIPLILHRVGEGARHEPGHTVSPQRPR